MISCVNLKVISSLIIILKSLLYFDFKEKPPIGWDNWRERSDWMENDQLLKLNGRYEYRKIYGITIWKRFYILHQCTDKCNT